MPQFEAEFEKFIEKVVIAHYYKLVRQEEQKFRRISNQLENSVSLERYEKKLEERLKELDDLELQDPFDS